MEKIIAQSDEQCSSCKEEIAKGSFFFLDGYGSVFCANCEAEMDLDTL